ncbi:MAG: glycosyltransferase family 2 protein, partial [Candidatus Thermoplasmatota archaeon]|nr:glycosyltransferase family 2 protein [Candidatus Thermoplasmatota archaeon]
MHRSGLRLLYLSHENITVGLINSKDIPVEITVHMTMKVSVVIPTINEENTIGSVISELNKIEDVEIIVVDTSSTDRTREIAKSLGATVIEQPKRGYGLAYKTGFSKCTGDIFVGIDGDNTYPAEAVKPLIDLMCINSVDFISCDRMTLRNEKNYTMLHFVGNSVLNIFIRLLFRFRMVDSQSGMWIFNGSLYPRMKHLSDGMAFSQDLKIEAYKLGKVIEIPIKYGVRVTKP